MFLIFIIRYPPLPTCSPLQAAHLQLNRMAAIVGCGHIEVRLRGAAGFVDEAGS